MATVPSSANVVVIGAGIVGNSLVWHLADLGWTGIVQIDKGPLPNPGGSTGHASNFIFPVDHSREITDLTLDSMRQYRQMGVFTESGGFEVARTEERMEELRRRMSSARAWGIPAELVTPDEVAAQVPFVEKDQIIGAFWTPGVGVVDSLRAGTLMRERAIARGALSAVANVEVIGLDTEPLGPHRSRRRITRVRTTDGDIEAGTVVIACGVWSPKLAAMADAAIPLTPAVHQMISVGPCPQLAEREGEISFPIVRDMDTFCYERQHGADMEVGSYAHRPILHDPEEIPSIDQARLSPTEMPFTEADFDPQLEQAFELMPDLLGADGAEIRYAINGLLSLTPDGSPILGETPEVAGLWSAAAIWIKEGPGAARAVAERMTRGWSEIDVSQSDIARFYDHQRRRAHVKARTSEAFNKTYGIVHPGEQYESDRQVRTAPMYDAQVAAGAVFVEAAGWERPFWYESNAHLVADYDEEAIMPRDHEWDARWWSPIINAEHLRMREAAGIVDLTAFVVLDLTGPAALDVVQRTCVAQCDVAVGKVVYTPVLDEHGGFVSDLTLMRLGESEFRVVTGGAHGMVDKKWFADRITDAEADGGTTLTDRTAEVTTIGLWGPKARDILAELTDDDVSHAGFGFGTCRTLAVAGHRVLASRISYVGELGWELYVPFADGAAVWDALHTAGAAHGAIGVGIGVYATTGRLEKGYRAFAAELDAERTIVQAGMARPRVKAADFVGRQAYLAQRESAANGTGPDVVLCTLEVLDHTSASGVKRYMLGGEPILTRTGQPIPGVPESEVHIGYVTTAGSAPSLRRHLLMAYLPAAAAELGAEYAVSYMEELYPVRVIAVDATSPFDPDNERIRR
ncbi:MAG: FAD-dependent oxidoreductase [Nocardioides sp.]|uniref:GcvT family protein n=1 Tax=Nocardioides sp. TaxID=35761 RepID=UPI0039E5BDEF